MAQPVASVYVDLGLNAGQFQSGLKAAGASVKTFEHQTEAGMARVGKSMNTAGASALSFGKSFVAGLAGGAAFATLSRLPSIIGDIIDEASRIVNVADRVGLATDAFQELQHAAKLADIEMGAFDQGLQIFGRTIGEAASGNGDFLKILQANNVALRDSSGQVRPMNELLGVYADLVKNAGSEQERLSLAQAAFGRGGAQFVTMLQNGSQGLRDAATDARNLGAVLDEDLLRKAEAVGDDWTRLTTKMGVVFKTMVLDIVNYSAQAVRAMRSVTVSKDLEYLREQRDALVDELGAVDTGAHPGNKIRDFIFGQPAAEEIVRQREDLLTRLNAINGRMLELQKELEIPPGAPPPPTILPPPPGGGAAGDARKGNIWGDDYTQGTEAVTRAIETYEDRVRSAIDVTQGLVSELQMGLQAGENFWDSLANAAVNSLQRIAQAAISSGIEKIIRGLIGSIGGAALGGSSLSMPGVPWSFGNFDIASGRAGGGPVGNSRIYEIKEVIS